MSYKYQIEKGHESRVFAGARNLGNGIVESDEELTSNYLTLIKDEPAQPEVPATPPAPTPPTPPATPQAAPAQPPQNEQTTNKETN
jgi:hypothetical protein